MIDHNDDPTAGIIQSTLYRFQVVEIFKGLPVGTKEVFVDPASMTSCYTGFELDKDYLVYTGGNQPAPAAATIINGRQTVGGRKQPLAAWKGLEQLPVYEVGGCNPTRTVEPNDPDLAFLRTAKADLHAGGWIEGFSHNGQSTELRLKTARPK